MNSIPIVLDEGNLKQMVDHMPQYIVRAPWYATTGLEEITTLDHQKITKEDRLNRYTPINNSTERGFYNEKVYKFRKGACENCGAMNHKTKECFERPRKRGAKYTKNNYRNDEFIKPIVFNNEYEGKRDRWNNYDTSREVEKIKEYNEIGKEIEDKNKENKQEIIKLEEVKEEDKLKEQKFQKLQELIEQKLKKEKEMKNKEEIILNKNDNDYKDKIKEPKLKEIVDKFGGGQYLDIPENIKKTNNIKGIELDEEEEENEEENEEEKTRKQEEKARIFRTMMMDKKNQVRLERKRIKLLAFKTKKPQSGLGKICESPNHS